MIEWEWLLAPVPLWVFIVALLTSPARWTSIVVERIEQLAKSAER